MTDTLSQSATDRARRRLSQLEILAGFGMFAMQERLLAKILDEACVVAANGLGRRYAKVLRFEGDTNDFLMCAGVGWNPGVVGHTRLGAGLDSPAGYAFHTGQPVTSNHVHDDDRFRTPAVLVEHGIERAINVIIRAGDAEPFGVLETDSTDGDLFDEHDTNFLQTLANTLGAALVMLDRLHAVEASETLSRGVFEASPDCIKVLDEAGRVEVMNVNGIHQMDCEHAYSLKGRLWTSVWPEEERPKAEAALAEARSGGRGHFTGFAPTLRGAPRHWDVVVAPIRVGEGPAERFVVVSRDVSELLATVIEKDKLLGEKDLLMQEVHHRVKNSLQLVRTLLQLQSRMQTNPETQAQLEEAAGRIMAIGAVHQRLYEGFSVAETDAVAYLEGVVGDMAQSTTAHVAGRAIALHVDPIVLPAEQITPLGLIVVELVTNALKYGAGAIGVEVGRAGLGLDITVTDEGPGFPPDFEPAMSRTLGMRLVSAWSKGSAGPRIDRSVPFGRITTTLVLPNA